MDLRSRAPSSNGDGQGSSARPSDRAWAESKDSTSARRDSFRPHALYRNAALWLGSRSKAAPHNSLIFSHCSGFSTLVPSHLARYPGLGHAPVALHRGGGNTQNFGGFLDGQSTEIPQLDHLALLCVPPR